MKYLFIFIKKQSFFFMFIILEVISILLLVNHNNFQGSRALNTTNAITGSLNYVYSSISDYFFLKEANQQLSDENAWLNERLYGGIKKIDSVQREDSLYSFIPARVISNTNRGQNNYIMINRGRADGVEKEMGLVSPYGVAGIIVEVSRNYATAMSLLHKDSRISARLKSNGQMVNVIWDGNDYRLGLIEDIPTHIIPVPGDTVITSGYSFVFPEGLIIGTIGERTLSGSNLNRAELIFSTDFNNLYQVYVTKNNSSQELDSLQMNTINE
jgi:rod shape-determining protein MreC